MKIKDQARVLKFVLAVGHSELCEYTSRLREHTSGRCDRPEEAECDCGYVEAVALCARHVDAEPTPEQVAEAGDTIRALRAEVEGLTKERDDARDGFADVRRLVTMLADAVEGGAGCCEAGRGSRLRQVEEHMQRIDNGKWAAESARIMQSAWKERDEAWLSFDAMVSDAGKKLDEARAEAKRWENRATAKAVESQEARAALYVANSDVGKALEERDRARAQLAQVQAEAGQLREALEWMVSPASDWENGDIGVGHRFRQRAQSALFATTAGRGYVSPERLRELLERAWEYGHGGRNTREAHVSDLLKEAQ